MAHFDDAFAQSAVPFLADTFGDQATYTAPGSSSSVTLCYAMFRPERRDRQPDEETGIYISVTREVAVMCDASHSRFCGVSQPVRGAQVAIDDQTYDVEEVIQVDASGLRTLKCVRHESTGYVQDGFFTTRRG